ncbi:MAG: class I SAM-dependent rRNA methyltransferase [Elusimicrobia bacterium]|nr:class I SAM-dependent rRNA methyltransferase [Elusimicrobiota bacterium]
MIKITLKFGEDKRLLAGHLWVFSNEIKLIDGQPTAGDIVEVHSVGGEYRGTGFYNPRSLIAVRILSRVRRDIDQSFFEEKIAAALAYRTAIYPSFSSYRLVFGESDGLPGLIIDTYDRYLVMQFLAAGMETQKESIVAAARKLLNPAGIIARNDSALRVLEGLPESTEVLWGEIPETAVIEEYNCSFSIDMTAGQKTGFFLDQKDNRQTFARYCAGKRVLDCFCHTGGFGIAAAKGGAASLVFVDSSRPAIELALANTERNAITVAREGIVADASTYLSTEARGNFDIINIDPPALIKSRKFYPQGYKAYRKLNTVALEALPVGGMLATSSCSHHLSPVDFRHMLEEAAARAGKQVRLVEWGTQSKDHPVLLSMPETEYLKFALLQVI